MPSITHGNAHALAAAESKTPTSTYGQFPDDVLRLLKSHTQAIVDELSAEDPMWKKIADSYYAFLEKSTDNQFATEVANLNTRKL